MRTLILCASAAVLLGGCGGAMGQAQFSERDSSGAQRLNAPLAVGASLEPEIELELDGSAAPTLELVSARPQVASVQDGRVLGTSPGVAAILVTTQEGTVLDFYHLWVAQPTRVSLVRVAAAEELRELEGGLDMLVGESVELEPKLYHQAQRLAGRVNATWAVLPNIATPMRSGAQNGRRLLATAPGEGQLRVTVGSIQLSLPLRVLAPPQRDAAPAPVPSPLAAPQHIPVAPTPVEVGL